MNGLTLILLHLFFTYVIPEGNNKLQTHGTVTQPDEVWKAGDSFYAPCIYLYFKAVNVIDDSLYCVTITAQVNDCITVCTPDMYLSEITGMHLSAIQYC